jgi:hypothetical protein
MRGRREGKGCMSDSEGGYPGSQGRNWSPAETIDDYMRNCREGLEIWSDRRAAKLLGMNRMQYRKALLLAEAAALSLPRCFRRFVYRRPGAGTAVPSVPFAAATTQLGVG